MNRASRAAFLALTSFLAVACGGEASETTPPTQLTQCTLIGCGDVVIVHVKDLLAVHESALPLTVETTMDGHTITAAIDLGVSGGEGCWQSETGTACCELDPPGSDFDCIPTVKGDLSLYLRVKENAFHLAKHDVLITVKGSDGGVLFTGQKTAELHMNQPNGPECEPTCYQGGVEFILPP